MRLEPSRTRRAFSALLFALSITANGAAQEPCYPPGLGGMGNTNECPDGRACVQGNLGVETTNPMDAQHCRSGTCEAKKELGEAARRRSRGVRT